LNKLYKTIEFKMKSILLLIALLLISIIEIVRGSEISERSQSKKKCYKGKATTSRRHGWKWSPWRPHRYWRS